MAALSRSRGGFTGDVREKCFGSGAAAESPLEWLRPLSYLPEEVSTSSTIRYRDKSQRRINVARATRYRGVSVNGRCLRIRFGKSVDVAVASVEDGESGRPARDILRIIFNGSPGAIGERIYRVNSARYLARLAISRAASRDRGPIYPPPVKRYSAAELFRRRPTAREESIK